MKRSLLFGLLFLLVSLNPLFAQPQTQGCGKNTMVELRNGTTNPGACGADAETSVLEFRALPFYTTYIIVVTDDDLNIIAATRNRKIDFSQLPSGSYRVYGMFYNGQLTTSVGMNANEDELASICYGFTDNFIRVSAGEPEGGMVTTADGLSSIAICADENTSTNVVNFATTSTDRPYQYVVTDSDNAVLALPEADSFDFAGLDFGRYLVYGFSYRGEITVAVGDTLDMSSTLASSCSNTSTNALEIINEPPLGGVLSFTIGGTSTFACESNASTLSIEAAGVNSTPYAYILTGRNNTIISAYFENQIDFSSIDPSAYRIYGVAYTGDLLVPTGEDIRMASLSDGCFELSQNFLSVTIPNLRTEDFELQSGGFNATICRDGSPNTRLTFKTILSNTQTKLFLVTDTANTILSIDISPTIDFAEYDQEALRVWCVSYTGSFLAAVGDNTEEVVFSSECYELSSEAVEVNQVFLSSGRINSADGGDRTTLCLEQDLNTLFPIDLSSLVGPEKVLLIVDQAGQIVDVVFSNAFSLEAAYPLNFSVYGLAYSGNLTAQTGDNINTTVFSDGCFVLSENAIFYNSQVIEGGTLQFSDSTTVAEVCIMDGVPDFLTFDAFNVGPAVSYRFVLTDQQDEIILSLGGNSLNFDVSNPGLIKVYGVSYSGEWTANAGRSIFGQDLSDECFDISDNFLSVNQIQVDGGTIQLEDGSSNAFVCKGGQADTLQFSQVGAMGSNYTYIVTDLDSFVLGQADFFGRFDFDQVAEDTLLVWGVAYSGDFMSNIIDDGPITALALSDGCYDISDNVITVIKTFPAGGSLQFADNAEVASFCSQEEDRMVYFQASGATTGNYTYLITTNERILVEVVNDTVFNFADYDLGIYQIYGLYYSGNLIASPGDAILSVDLSSDCFELSSNALQVNIDELDGGTIALSNGESEYYVCDEQDDVVFSMQDVISTGDEYTFLFVDLDNKIVGFSTEKSNSIMDIGAKVFHVYGLTYSGDLLVNIGDDFSREMSFSTECFDLSDNAAFVSMTIPDGGTIRFADGIESVSIGCMDTEQSLAITAENTSLEDNYTYLITDLENRFISAQSGPLVDFTSIDNGAFRVWGLSYSGQLSLSRGQDLTTTDLSSGCFDLSDNFLDVNKENAQAGRIITPEDNNLILVCAASPIIDLQVEGAIGEGYRYLIVNTNGVITAIESDTPFEVAFQSDGALLVYGLGYNGTLLATVGSNITDNLVDGCFELTSNPIQLMQAAPEGGSIELAVGGSSATLCPDDIGVLDFVVSANSDEETQYLLITNEDNEFLRAFEGSSFDFSAFGDGLYHIWSVNASGSIIINEGDDVTNTEIASQCFDLSDDFVSINRMDPIGGEVIAIGGGATVFACPDQNVSNTIEFETVGTQGTGMLAYILTDADDLILTISASPSLDLGALAGGAYKVYGLTYNGTLNTTASGNVNEAALASSCFELSSNVVDVNLAIPTGGSITGNGLSGDKVCINNIDNSVDLEVLGRSTNTAYTFIVANDQNQFLFSIMDEPITLDFLFQGDLKVWGLAYTGNLTINPFDDVLNTVLSDDCFDLSENALTIVKEDIDGGRVAVLQGGTEAYACPGDGIPDIIEVQNTSTSPNANYTYIITTADNNILSPMESGSRDFDNIGAFPEVRIWGLSYTGTLNLPVFQNILSIDLSDGCFDLSDNFVTLYRDEPEAGEISTDLGAGDLLLCPGAIPDVINLNNTSTSTAGYAYILEDANDTIQQIITDAQLNVRTLALGDYTLYGLSYTGNLTINEGDVFDPANPFSDNCHELASTPITLTRGGEVDGGRLSTASGDTLIYTCPGDFRGDVVFVIAPDAIPGTTYRIVVTGPDNNILFPNIEEGNIPFDGVAAGEYRIWGVSFTGEYRGQFGQNILNDVLSTDCYTTSENFITVISVNPDAGAINTIDGRTDITIDENNADEVIQFGNTSVSNAPYFYLRTSEDGTILDIFDVDTLNTTSLENGAYRIYGANHAGNFIAEAGDNLFSDPLADNCFSITPNHIDIIVNRGDDGGTIIGDQVFNKTTRASARIQESMIKLFPNPVHGDILRMEVNWVNQIQEKGHLSILDMSGKLIMRESVDLYVGQQLFQVDVRDLNPGMYIVRLMAGGESLQHQLVRQ